ncbi:MAG: ImmA/IrrE family metallo-endopeptidase [Candidatus Paceibacterota bacterium]|jgi:hypothetical protein|nr:ImmA/IrrE family metallo-endopeptidase [Candidatus Paceibacterota bacterium]MDD4830742.1 ImmA/IrrE family metallo-endopeptidase [Candidatus Paceibacterota bacterium]MDD4874840.1 ImmA/IrrE family metallo-endopeptidase [Candidatus Paceibacterota bacterium]
MKFPFIFLFFVVSFLSFFPGSTDLAKRVEDLNFYLVGDVKAACGNKNSALGCIYIKDKAVYVSKRLNKEQRKFVLSHEIGHYYLDGADLEKMIPKRTGKGKDMYSCGIFGMDDVEALADLFYDYLYNQEYLEKNYSEVKGLYDRLLSI